VRNWRGKWKDRGLWNESVKQIEKHDEVVRRLKKKKNKNKNKKNEKKKEKRRREEVRIRREKYKDRRLERNLKAGQNPPRKVAPGEEEEEDEEKQEEEEEDN
jgi:hypothetical protein